MACYAVAEKDGKTAFVYSTDAPILSTLACKGGSNHRNKKNRDHLMVAAKAVEFK